MIRSGLSFGTGGRCCPQPEPGETSPLPDLPKNRFKTRLSVELELEVKVPYEHRVEVRKRNHPLLQLVVNGVHQVLVGALLVRWETLLHAHIESIVTSL